MSLSIPKELAEEIQKAMEGSALGYTSLTEFVRDAIRTRLIELRRR